MSSGSDKLFKRAWYVLELSNYGGFCICTCIGYAHSRDRRCDASVRTDRLNDRLYALVAGDLNNRIRNIVDLVCYIVDTVGVALCPKHRASQCNGLARKWMEILIREGFPLPGLDQADMRVVDNIITVREYCSLLISGSHVSLPEPSRALERPAKRVLLPGLRPLLLPREPQLTAMRVWSLRAATTAAIREVQSLQPPQPVPPAEDSNPTQLGPSAQHPTPAQLCGRFHAPPRPIEHGETCAICLDPLFPAAAAATADTPRERAEMAKHLPELVWCKGQCGRIFHQQCLCTWFFEQSLVKRAMTCAFCRSPWLPLSCRCDKADEPDKPRRKRRKKAKRAKRKRARAAAPAAVAAAVAPTTPGHGRNCVCVFGARSSTAEPEDVASAASWLCVALHGELVRPRGAAVLMRGMPDFDTESVDTGLVERLLRRVPELARDGLGER